MTTTVLPDPASEPVISIERAGAILGLGRSAAYDAARRGEIPSLRVGRRVLVPTARLRALLGVDVEPVA
jgi:excisionase family DNA binding protein